jgi:N-acyl-D-amino-acid deacylase
MSALPPWIQEGGIDATLARLRDPVHRPALNEWFTAGRQPLESVRLSYFFSPDWKRYEGQTLPEAAGTKDPVRLGEFVCEALLASAMAVGCVVPHRRRGEEDVRELMRHPAMMAGSDCIFTGAFPHPRGCGCFARYLGHYVRAGVWTLEEAVQHLAAHGARRFGLRDRGLISPGMTADVVVFDPDRIADRSTYDDGRLLAEGMEHVLVNGELVLHNGTRTPALPGRALRPC